MAAHFAKERGSAKVSWNFLAMAVSGVTWADPGARGFHLFNRTFFACFSGWGGCLQFWPPNALGLV